MTRSFSRLRTVICAGVAWITSPWNRTSFGLDCLIGMGLLVSTCARRGTAAASSAAAATTMPRMLQRIIERNLQRLQKANVLRCDLKFRRPALILQHFLVHLDMQRLQEPPVLRGDRGRLGFALGQPDCGIELEHNVIACGAHVGNGPGNAFGIRYRVVDGVAEFPQQLFELVVQLQGRSLLGKNPWSNCRAQGRRKQDPGSQPGYSVRLASPAAPLCTRIPACACNGSGRWQPPRAALRARLCASPGRCSTKRPAQCSFSLRCSEAWPPGANGRRAPRSGWWAFRLALR